MTDDHGAALNLMQERVTARVRYFETDQMGVAHHAHYFVWFEAARSGFCRKYGIDYAALEREGFALPVVEATCRYRRPAKYDDEVVVCVRLVERRRHTLRFQYTVERGGELLAEGETVQMLVNSSGKPCSFPMELAGRFDRP
ncbi:MAG TPA: thioesterase family protein [Chthonomonadales bacterium]|nr:thioesterase family protein [Chthonomonadales bacterium]